MMRIPGNRIPIASAARNGRRLLRFSSIRRIEEPPVKLFCSARSWALQLRSGPVGQPMAKSHLRLFHSSQIARKDQQDNGDEPENKKRDNLELETEQLYKDFKEIIDQVEPDKRITRLLELYKKHDIKEMNDPLIFNMMQYILKTDLRFDSKLLLTQIFQESVLTYLKLSEEEAAAGEGAVKVEDTAGAKSGSKSGAKPENGLKTYTFKLDETTLLLTLAVLLFYFASPSSLEHEITWQEFRTSLLDKNFVEKLTVVNKNLVYITLNQSGKNHSLENVEYYFTIGSVDNFEHKLLRANEENGVAEEFRVPVIYVSYVSPFKVVFQFLPTVLMLYGLYWITRKTAKSAGGLGGGLFGSGKSKLKKFNLEKDVKVKFDDVAGCDELKEEITEFVKFLQNPKKYEKLGAKIPRGAILSGSPGTGKTLLAKATAGEAGVPFYSVSGSEFVEMFVGVGASRVRDLFKTAREDLPSIIFIDEIDAIGKSRSKRSMGGNDERENTLNQLLVEMDGFSTSDHVVVLAGTNRPDVLDQLLMRPGRFDRKISIDNPELEGRKQIFAVHLRKIKLDPSRDVEDLKGRLAALTPGFSGADIANCCNEAALILARNDAESVALKHFEQAIERVIAGLEKKTRVLSPQEKKIVLYHEAGHAICGWFLKHADPLLKVSIIPRGSALLGYAQYLPPDIYLYSVDRLMDRMTMTLGGRVSEELNFQSVTSGGSDDFEKVTAVAQRMVIECGMSPKIGFINFNQDRGNDMTKPYSDKTLEIIDEEIHRIVNECYDRCTKLLTEKSEQVKLVAEELLKKEFITREDMIRLLGKRPFPNQNDAFDKYLDESKYEEKDGSQTEKKDEQQSS